QKQNKEWPSNQVELSGYAGKDPKFQRYGENRLKASFTLGTHQLFRDKNGQWIRTTVWHTIVAWDYAARKTVDMVRRGSHVSLKGRLRSYETEIGDGKKENRVYVIANDLTVNIAA
ncbi:MAG: single-stranded DNA-binding protein, partial [Bacteroidales bacterium]